MSGDMTQITPDEIAEIIEANPWLESVDIREVADGIPQRGIYDKCWLMTVRTASHAQEMVLTEPVDRFLFVVAMQAMCGRKVR